MYLSVMIQPEDKLEQAAKVLKILAHPISLRIIRILSEQPELNVSAVQAKLNRDQTTVSRHLIRLKDYGFLASARKGKEIHYSLTDLSIIHIPELLLSLSVYEHGSKK